MPKYLAPIDLAKNELRNARIQNLATAPSSPVVGQIYFDSTEKNFFFFDGDSWHATYQSATTPSGPASGELSGTYPAPSIAEGVITNAKVAANAAIALSKLATDPLARTNHTGTQPAATISDFHAQVRSSTLDQMAAPTASVSFNDQRLTGLAEPTAAQDGATKGYVDSVATGLDVKASVRVATTGNVTLTGTQTIDGVTLSVGDRVLAKSQDDPTDNGIYVVATGSWARADDAASNDDVTPGMFTFVEQGAVNADSGWVLTTDRIVNLGVTDLVFTQFTGAGQITAGAGITKTGNILDIGGTVDRIYVDADSIDIASTYLGQTSITTLGTVTTGTWQGNPVDITYGGTGSSTAAGARAALGAVTKYSVVNGGTTTDSVVHNLGTADVTVTVRDTTTGQVVYPEVYITDPNTVTVMYGSAPASSSLRITVIG